LTQTASAHYNRSQIETEKT